jgi:hypothetical protein
MMLEKALMHAPRSAKEDNGTYVPNALHKQ